MSKFKLTSKPSTDDNVTPLFSQPEVADESSFLPEVPAEEQVSEEPYGAYGEPNEDEIEALIDSAPAHSNGVSIDRLNASVDAITDYLRIPDGSAVIDFKDKGKKISVTFANGDFTITVLCHDPEKYGIEGLI